MNLVNGLMQLQLDVDTLRREVRNLTMELREEQRKKQPCRTRYG